MKRIKKDDEVIIIAGKSKGHIGKVLKVFEDTLVVEGGNMIKKHMKPNPQSQDAKNGGIISREAPIHISNVAQYNSITNKADRVGFKFIDINGIKKKVRFYKSNEELIDRV
jgi:large subunit ribosomal protein L24